MFASKSWTDLITPYYLSSDMSSTEKATKQNSCRLQRSQIHYWNYTLHVPANKRTRKPYRTLISLHIQVSRCPSFTLTLLLENSNSLLSASSSLTWCERVAMPICCSSGRSVAREAQMQPSETSMKLQMLSGTIVSKQCARRLVSKCRSFCKYLRSSLTGQIFGD